MVEIVIANLVLDHIELRHNIFTQSLKHLF